MGLCWKKVPFVLPVAEQGIEFKGDPTAWPKWTEPLWRFQQQWEVLYIFRRGNGYRVTFTSCGHSMEYRRLLRSDYIAVRIGPEDTWFQACDEYGRILSMSHISSFPSYWEAMYGQKKEPLLPIPIHKVVFI